MEPPRLWFTFSPNNIRDCIFLDKNVSYVCDLKRAIHGTLFIRDYSPAQLVLIIEKVVQDINGEDFSFHLSNPDQSLRDVITQRGINIPGEGEGEQSSSLVLSTFAENFKVRVFPPKAIISQSEFIRSYKPPSLHYAYIGDTKSHNTSQSNYLQGPNHIAKWKSFNNAVTRHRVSNVAGHEPPIFITYNNVCCEPSVQSALHDNVLRPLSQIIGSELSPSVNFARCHVMPGIEGEPDFIFYKPEMSFPIKSPKKLLLPNNVKTRWVLNTDDLVMKYFQDTKNLPPQHLFFDNTPNVVNSIHQIYGYMLLNNCQYGVLTTYDRTFFLKRPREEPNTLYVSPCIKNDSSNPTLFHCYAYIMSLAHNEPDGSDTLPPATDRKSPTVVTRFNAHNSAGNSSGPSSGASLRDDSISDNSKNTQAQRGTRRCHHAELLKDVEVQELEYFDFHKKGILGFGRNGVVREVEWGGENLALKISDISQHPKFKGELLNEIAIYNTLKDLQGHYIPKLKTAGDLWGGMFFGIATEIVGSKIEPKTLNYAERLEIVEALSAIHRHGILHNDIRNENILIQRSNDGFRISFIDFAFSEQTNDKEKLSEEMAELKYLLGIPTNPSKIIIQENGVFRFRPSHDASAKNEFDSQRT